MSEEITPTLLTWRNIIHFAFILAKNDIFKVMGLKVTHRV